MNTRKKKRQQNCHKRIAVPRQSKQVTALDKVDYPTLFCFAFHVKAEGQRRQEYNHSTNRGVYAWKSLNPADPSVAVMMVR